MQNLIAEKANLSYVNALNAVVENLKVEKLNASEFTAQNISAMNITVSGANVTGTLTANKISAGTVIIGGSAHAVAWNMDTYVRSVIPKFDGPNTNYMTDVDVTIKTLYYLGVSS